MSVPLPSGAWASEVVAKIWNFDGHLPHVWQILREAVKERSTTKGTQQKEDVETLALEFFRSATMTSNPDERMYQCFKSLVHSETISWTCFLKVLKSFSDFKKTNMMIFLLHSLRNVLNQLTCSTHKVSPCQEFQNAIVNLFPWFVEALQCKSGWASSENHTLLTHILNTAVLYIEDKMIHQLLQLSIATDDSLRSLVLEPLISFKEEIPLSHAHNLDLLIKHLESLLHQHQSENPASLLFSNSYKNRAGVRSLTSVFARFRVLTPAHEVVDTLIMFGTLNGYENTVLLGDFLSTAIIIHMEQISELDGARRQMTSDVVHQRKINRDPDTASAFPLSVYFFNRKVPSILKGFVDRGYISRALVVTEIVKTMERLNKVLDNIDMILRENGFEIFLLECKNIKLLDESEHNEVKETRQRQIRSNRSLNDYLISNINEKNNTTAILGMSGKIKAALDSDFPSRDDKAWITDVFMMLLKPNAFNLHAVFAMYTVQGANEMYNFSRKIAQECKAMEIPTTSTSQILFEVSFAILLRFSYILPSTTALELVTGSSRDTGHDNVNGVFYKWATHYHRRICPNEDSTNSHLTPFCPEVDHSVRAEYAQRVKGLRNGIIIWDSSRLNYEEFMNLIPIIGSVWYDEFRQATTNEARNRIAFEFAQILPCFYMYGSGILGLAQWIECQESSSARKCMAISLLSGVEKCRPSDEKFQVLWQFVEQTIKRILEDVTSDEVCDHNVSILLKSIAQRVFPVCQRLQVPDTNMLRDVLIYSYRQSWLNPRCLTHLDHCNRASDQKRWIRLFLNYMLEMCNYDAMSNMIELILAALLLDPIRSHVICLQEVYNYMHETEEDDKKREVQSDPCHLHAIAKLAVQVLLVSTWLVEKHMTESEPSQAKRSRLNSGEEIHDSHDPNTLAAFVNQSVSIMITKSGVFEPKTATLFIWLKTLADSPISIPRSIILPKINHETLFRMCKLEPMAMSLDVFSKFCDPNSKEHTNEKLQYVCLLRKLGAL